MHPPLGDRGRTQTIAVARPLGIRVRFLTLSVIVMQQLAAILLLRRTYSTEKELALLRCAVKRRAGACRTQDTAKIKLPTARDG